MTADAPTTATSAVRRERVREACAPLHGESQVASALALSTDAIQRFARMASIASAKVAPEREADALAAWADLLVRTEAEISAQDVWEPDAAAEQREEALRALLAGIDALRLHPDWGEVRAMRFAALVATRWAEVMEPKAVKAGDAR